MTDQPTLFAEKTAGGPADFERLTLYALGEFQSRGKVLAGRELPLDRLRGALRRASETLGVEEPGDEQAVSTLESLGARVRRVPPFVAKHPFRVTAPQDLADRARLYFDEQQSRSEDDAS